MEASYKQLFGYMQDKKHRSPLPDGDHPELDTSAFLDEENSVRYQSLVGSMQWAISIGRWDIQTAVMSMSSFRAQPRKGHMKRVKRIYGHLSRFRCLKIRFRTDEPDLPAFDNKTKLDWSTTVYGDATEEKCTRAAKETVTLTH